jgi:hypothetical protein
LEQEEIITGYQYAHFTNVAPHVKPPPKAERTKRSPLLFHIPIPIKNVELDKHQVNE